MSTDHYLALNAWKKDQNSKQGRLSDFPRKMLPAFGAMETNEASPVYRYAKRAYVIIDNDGVIRYQKIQANPLDLLDPEEVLKALKDAKLS